MYTAKSTVAVRLFLNVSAFNETKVLINNV